ncbi:hypothetical protein [Roseateles saccharophilus]|uniref:Uncharacterized protein n=1 Tax=Roseateles saccharophilus TaxID=304 RepID=A0A4R3VIX4_ROSSA|nr:hypothetical protein [Roseateles saccharophilus]MDG0831211.1 hypothetical protein [Roseateles saccharophilus]TCV04331.1 hypothetical protein EV671_100186 [Roseateles saccharophilus]
MPQVLTRVLRTGAVSAERVEAPDRAAAETALTRLASGTAAAPVMAGFSSRGPKQGDSNLMKPDLTAPGVDVIAQVTALLSQADRDGVAAGTTGNPQSTTVLRVSTGGSVPILSEPATVSSKPQVARPASFCVGFAVFRAGPPSIAALGGAPA